MPNQTTPPKPVKLPAEIKQQLEAQGEFVEVAQKQIQTLKKLGIDTKQMEEKLEWAEEARKTLLSEFG
jgi:hypothetical protein